MKLKELKKLVDEKIEQGYGEHVLFSRGPKYGEKAQVILEPYLSEYYNEEVILLVRIR